MTERVSRNHLVKTLLARAMGVAPADKDNDEFLGLWTEAERQAFDRTQAENQNVRAEEWT